jgi:hypothetical protein
VGSETILLLLAGVGGCHGSRECCASLCVWRGYSLQISWAWNFLINSIQTPLASSLCKFHRAFHLSKQQHPILDANTPLKSWGVAAVSDGVFVFWYILNGEELVEKKIHLDGIPKFSCG